MNVTPGRDLISRFPPFLRISRLLICCDSRSSSTQFYCEYSPPTLSFGGRVNIAVLTHLHRTFVTNLPCPIFRCEVTPPSFLTTPTSAPSSSRPRNPENFRAPKLKRARTHTRSDSFSPWLWCDGWRGWAVVTCVATTSPNACVSGRGNPFCRPDTLPTLEAPYS